MTFKNVLAQEHRATKGHGVQIRTHAVWLQKQSHILATSVVLPQSLHACLHCALSSSNSDLTYKPSSKGICTYFLSPTHSKFHNRLSLDAVLTVFTLSRFSISSLSICFKFLCHHQMLSHQRVCGGKASRYPWSFLFKPPWPAVGRAVLPLKIRRISTIPIS